MPMLTSKNRTIETDKLVSEDMRDVELRDRVFVRLTAKGRSFSRVDFRYSTFDAAYIRDCTFDECDFTGCRFVSSNFHGSRFSGVKFDYAAFDKTQIDSEILDTCCPSYENLKLRFARTLRMNFQQLGDAVSVNRAIHIELEATEVHLRKAWQSRESYYRKKHKGLKRFEAFLGWLQFKALDAIWGNGESMWKLVRALGIVTVVIAAIDVLRHGDAWSLRDWLSAVIAAPQFILGASIPKGLPGGYVATVIGIRLVAVGFFMSILIKRFNRR
jgi:hypothetical protein